VITIKDGIVTLSEEHVIRRVGLDAFKDKLAVGLKVQTPVLPRASILYAAKGIRSLVVLEEPPQVRTIEYRTPRGAIRAFTIPLPWVYFVPIFHNSALDQLQLYFSPKGIQSDADFLFFPTLPNTNEDCHVCLGDYRYSITRSLASHIADVSRYYWASTFNTDLSNLYSTKMPEEIRDATPASGELFEGWAKISLERVTGLSWHEHARLNQVITRLLP